MTTVKVVRVDNAELARLNAAFTEVIQRFTELAMAVADFEQAENATDISTKGEAVRVLIQEVESLLRNLLAVQSEVASAHGDDTTVQAMATMAEGITKAFDGARKRYDGAQAVFEQRGRSVGQA